MDVSFETIFYAASFVHSLRYRVTGINQYSTPKKVTGRTEYELECLDCTDHDPCKLIVRDCGDHAEFVAMLNNGDEKGVHAYDNLEGAPLQYFLTPKEATKHHIEILRKNRKRRREELVAQLNAIDQEIRNLTRLLNTKYS